jgi:transposase-like protein
MPRPYPPEFRQRALDLVRSGRSVPEVAGLLGIAQSCLYRWKQQDLIDRRLKAATGRVESAELVAARQKDWCSSSSCCCLVGRVLSSVGVADPGGTHLRDRGRCPADDLVLLLKVTDLCRESIDL